MRQHSGYTQQSDLFLSFPVASVDTLCKAAHVLELSWFAYAADFVFDMVGQTSIKLVMKGSIAIALELRHEAVEFHNCNDRILSPFILCYQRVYLI